MVESLKHIFDLVFDKTKSWGFKTAATISIIGLLFVADLLFNFSYNLFINNKINQLKEIQNLKTSYKYDKPKLNKVLLIEERILNREHYTDFISRNISSFNFKYEVNRTKENQENTKERNQGPIRSTFWMVLSSNYMFVIFFPFLLFVPLFGKDTRKANLILGWIASLIMIVVFTAIVTWIAYQIPLIFGNPIYNYFLNFVIHTIFWIIIYKIGNDNKKTNAI